AEAYQFNQWQAMIEGSFHTGSVEHQVVLGSSWQKQKNDFSVNGFYDLVGTGNLEEQNENAYYSAGGFDMYRGVEIAQQALFASDTLKLTDRVSVLAGLRYTDYRQKNLNADGTQ